MGDKKSYVMYKTWNPMLLALTDNQLGQLMRSIVSFQEGNISEPDDPTINAIYLMIIRAMQDDNAKYLSTCLARSEAGKLGGRPKANAFFDKQKKQMKAKEADKDKDKDKEKDKDINNKAKPASIEEVAAYCRERGNKVDPQKWYDYYSANGWKVGKNSMKDWKACVRTWEKNSYDKPIKGWNTLEQKSPVMDFDAIERMRVVN